MQKGIRLTGWILLTMWLMATTCERPVVLDIEAPPARLAISSAFTLGEPVKVQVTRTQSIFDDEDPVYLANAVVTLFEGDRLIEELELIIEPAERIRPYFVTPTFTPLPSTTYTIRVEAPGFETVEARSFIPEPVKISKLAVSNVDSRLDSANQRRIYSYDLYVNFDDPKSETNYYHLNVFQEVFLYNISPRGDTLINGRTLERINFEVDDERVITDEIIGGVLLKDNPFEEGVRVRGVIDIVPAYEDLGKVFVELRTVTEEYYLYYTTYSRQQNQVEGPFNDPVIIFNNIENGHGHFVGYNITQDSVKLNF